MRLLLRLLTLLKPLLLLLSDALFDLTCLLTRLRPRSLELRLRLEPLLVGGDLRLIVDFEAAAVTWRLFFNWCDDEVLPLRLRCDLDFFFIFDLDRESC